MFAPNWPERGILRGNLQPFDNMPNSDSKIFVQFLHGRSAPDEVLDDWGADGPCVGPFDWFHSTYLTTLTFGTTEEGELWDVRDSLADDLIFYDGVYYGDFEIVAAPKGGGPVEPFDLEKTILPK